MRAVVVYNKYSGNYQVETIINQVKEVFGSYFHTLFFYETKSIKELYEDVLTETFKCEVVLIVGGDGTISTVINALMQLEERPRLFPLPFGTTNDISRMLGIRKNLLSNVHILEQDSYLEVDLLKVNQNYALYAFAGGKYTDVSYAPPRKWIKRLGYLTYVLYIVKGFFKRFNQKITIETEGKVIELKSYLVLGALSPRMGGYSLHKFDKSTQMNDGKVSIVFYKSSPLGFLKPLFFYVRHGKYSKKDYVLTLSEARITLSKPWAWNLDGEKGVEGTVDIKVIPKAIKIYGSKIMLNKLTERENYEDENTRS